jgi:hypothetical protein
VETSKNETASAGVEPNGLVGPFVLSFLYKNDDFTKTGSGQTRGSTQKKTVLYINWAI